VIVADAGPLIALARIDQLEILPPLAGPVLIPEPVAQECLRKPDRPDARAIALAIRKKVLIRKPAQMTHLYERLLRDLGEGEAAAIILANSRKCPVLLDERKARRIAERLALEVVGTGGVLAQAKRLGLVAHVKPLLEGLRASGYRLSDGLIKELRRLARMTQ
jgi:hypothetical protein